VQALRLENRSGKVIALGRLTLACFFGLALAAGGRAQAVYPAWTYALAGFYAAAAAAVLALTWSNWWLDHKLRLPAHLLDLTVFAALLLSIGATIDSPFFTFFVFLVLSAAVRWGWKHALLTAAVVAALFGVGTWAAMASGALPAEDLSRVVLRGGHLLVLSFMITWFGVTHFSARPTVEATLPQVIASEPPAGRAAKHFGECFGAAHVGLAWTKPGDKWLHVTRWQPDNGVREERIDAAELGAMVAPALDGKTFLADLPTRRVLVHEERRTRAIKLPAAVHPELALLIPLTSGLATPLKAKSFSGYLFADDVPGLCGDDMLFGEELSEQIGLAFDRSASLDAAAEAAESQTRLDVARDLHDSVAQILAGLAMRLRAARTTAADAQRDEELAGIEQELAGYQKYIYGVIEGLRGPSPVPQPIDLRLKLSQLARQLKRQWGIDVTIEGRPLLLLGSTFALDVELILREAVSNAVRHGGARRVTLSAAVDGNSVMLRCKDDGGGFEQNGTFSGEELRARGFGPTSILERVGQLGGEVGLSSAPDGATVMVTLPIGQASP
jgi:signal transduction histidine kinase